jgi:hypothetical protein
VRGKINLFSALGNKLAAAGSTSLKNFENTKKVLLRRFRKNYMIPIVQPTLFDFDQVVAEFRQAWDSGQVTTGVFTRRFEEAVEGKLGVPQAIMVQSCTAGLMLVLRALDLKGEVILPAFTWTATAHAVVWNGLTPVFADIVPGAYTLDPQVCGTGHNRTDRGHYPGECLWLPPGL